MTPPLGRILVVDDSPSARKVIQICLELEGFQVHTAADGHTCLNQVPRLRPDLITLDVQMPHMDGLTAAKTLRAQPSTHDLPLVLITADDSPAIHRQATQLGINAVLVKPFDPNHLVTVVRRLLAPGNPG